MDSFSGTYYKNSIKKSSKKNNPKSYPELEKVFKDHKFGLETGLNNDFDCSNGKEGSFVLYATFADLKKVYTNFERIKDEFWFNPDGPVNYQIPELNKAHLEADRVCCSCTDGCISEHCECKKEMVFLS